MPIRPCAERADIERQIADPIDAAQVQTLIGQIKQIDDQIELLYLDPEGSSQCTGTFPSNRYAYVQVALVAINEPKVQCGLGDPDNPGSAAP